MAIETATPRKTEAFVEERLQQLSARLTRHERLIAGLRLAAIALGMPLALALGDLAVQAYFPAVTTVCRWLGFAIFAGLLGWAGVALVQVWRHRIHPLYVAWLLEKSLPGSKNSLVNWIDLHDAHLPSAIRASLTQRAAAGLKQTDLEQLDQPRPLWIWGGVLSVLVVGLAALAVWRGAQFGSLMSRAIVPWRQTALASRVQIHLQKPGNVEIPRLQDVEVVAAIDGPVPVAGEGAPTLRFRNRAEGSFLDKPLFQDAGGLWTTKLTPTQIQSGLTYFVTAADAVTPEYEIRVRGPQFVQTVDVAYEPKVGPRPAPFTVDLEKFQTLRLEERRGTVVRLIVHAKQPVQPGVLEIDSSGPLKRVSLRAVPDDPHALAADFALEEPGQFRLAFKSAQGDWNAQARQGYDIVITKESEPIAKKEEKKSVREKLNQLIDQVAKAKQKEDRKGQAKGTNEQETGKSGPGGDKGASQPKESKGSESSQAKGGGGAKKSAPAKDGGPEKPSPGQAKEKSGSGGKGKEGGDQTGASAKGNEEGKGSSPKDAGGSEASTGAGKSGPESSPAQGKGSQEEPKAQAKNEPGQTPAGEPKSVPAPNQPASAGKTSGANSQVTGRAKDNTNDAGREPTPQELEQMMKLAQQPGVEGSLGMQTLVEMGQQSEPGPAQAIESFLKKMGRPDLAKKVEEAQGESSAGSKPGPKKTLPTPEAMRANEELARKGGNLQLEDLKKYVTAHVVKKAQLTDAEWQAFWAEAQRDPKAFAQAKQAWQAALKAPDLGVQAVAPVGTSENPAERIDLQAPPELIRAYEELTKGKK